MSTRQHSERTPDSFEDFIATVEQAARDYVAGDRKQTDSFRAKWLALPGDPSTRRIGIALTRLEERGVIERAERGYNSALKWRFCDATDEDESGSRDENIPTRPWYTSEYESRQDWSDTYEVYGEFVPVPDEDILHPLNRLRDVTTFLTSREPHCRQVSTAQLTSKMGIQQHSGGAFSLEDFCLLNGWWRGGEQPSSGAYYCNPRYVHSFDEEALTLRDADDPAACRDQRLALLERAARLGLPSKYLTDAFGVADYSSVRRYAHRHGVSWDTRRKSGRRRMARTWKLLAEWGYSHPEIAETFGRPRSTVSTHIAKYAADFEPPDRDQDQGVRD